MHEKYEIDYREGIKSKSRDGNIALDSDNEFRRDTLLILF